MVFIAYRSDLYKEFVLPNTDNSDYSLILDRHIFGFKEDITLRIEVADSVRKIQQSSDYRIKLGGEVMNGCVLKHGDILSFKTRNGEYFNGIIADTAPSFSVLTKYDITGTSYISIGEDKDNIISYSFNDLVSKFHCEIKKKNDGFYITDNSKNGIFLNSRRLDKTYRLKFGDVINIFGLQILFLDTLLGVASNYGEMSINGKYLHEWQPPKERKKQRSVSGADDEVYFNRSPRMMHTLHTEPVVIEEPPAPKFTKKKPVIYTIGPAFTMAIPMLLGSSIAIISAQSRGGSASAFMYTGIITAIGSAIIGTIWALLNLRYSRQSELQEEQERFNAYGNYLMQQVELIKSYYTENASSMNSMYPSAADCCKYDVRTSALWNRNHSHSDFLFCRLGIGDVPFQVDIDIPKSKFNVVQDSLREKPAVIKSEYATLKNVPVGIDMLKSRLYGIVGGSNRSGAMKMMYNIVSQVAANNCYTDVKMVFVYNEKNREDKLSWDFARWLPHVWSEDKKTRYLATNKLEAADVFYELANILRMRGETSKEVSLDKTPVQKPHYILFIEDAEMLEGQLISKYVFDPRPEYGITSFIMSKRRTDLPNECENIIQCDKHFSGVYNVADINTANNTIAFDNVSYDELLRFSKRLSEVKVNEMESILDIPAGIDFFEMYGVGSLEEFSVEERWRKNRTFNTMKALIGKKAGGQDCYLDIHEKYHGPHGLVAGTTGSGKSELLQTYILSLALNYSPEDVAFFVIDYKGGGMANLFEGLPHMIGQISNLSGNQIRRAMISIKSENRRRQRLFNDAGVNNINLYTRLYKNHEVSVPIPHLFIIIDEFAELKKEEPDFMRELISVAQVGRSLGIHLILATQKPNGTVDDNIWSNSKFRLCLRVQDRQDSNDMLHKPDAAYISQAGRAYLQVGNDEIYEMFQSGWSGATYNENEGVLKNEIAKMIQNTGKTAIVGSRHQKKAKEKERHKWYSQIAQCVHDAAAALGISEPAAAVSDGDAELLITTVIENMHSLEMDYADTQTNRINISNFIKLWPEGVSDNGDIVASVQKRSAEEGIRLPEKREKTQLEAIVNYLAKVADKGNYNYNLKLWLPVLPSVMYLNDDALSADEIMWKKTAQGKWDLSAVIGMYDDPRNQSQLPLSIDFAEDGHHAVCGMVVSGKSTLLQTLVYSLICKYSPEHLNLYLVDFSSHMLTPFEDAPHCGGVVTDQDMDKVSKFFSMLKTEMDRRKAILDGGDYIQYVRSGKKDLPAWVIAIDNYSGFREKTASEYDDAVLRVAKEGIGYGIFLVVSAGGFGMNEIPGRIGDNIRTVISLELGDKFKYMDVMRTTGITTLPEVGVKGRGIANVDGNLLEFHTALAIEAEDDFVKSRLITERCRDMSEMWTGARARRIPEIPHDFTSDVLRDLDGYKETVERGGIIPYALKETDASVYGIDLSRTYCYSITGKSRVGKTNALKIMMMSAKDVGGKLYVFEKGISELKKTAESCGAEYISDDKSHFAFWSGIKDEFIRRNQIKRGLINDGCNESEIYGRMKNEEPIYLFVSDITSFMESIYKPEAGVGDMKGFVENVMEKGILHNIFIIACINTDNVAVAGTYNAYKSFVGYKTGVHLGGNVSAQRIFTFQNIPYAEQSKAMKKGFGLVPSAEDDTVSEQVVIPVV